jgi:hypothetical protein
MSRSKPSNNSSRKRTEEEKLKLFIKRSHELQETNIAMGNYTIIHKKESDPIFPIETCLTQPDEPAVKDYLLSFRQFISEEEDVYITGIMNICYKNLQNEDMKQGVAYLRALYKTLQNNRSLIFIYNNVEYTPESITKIFVNAHYFHNDLDGQMLLNSLPPFAFNFFRSSFLQFLNEVSKVIVCLSHDIEKSFEENLFLFKDTR